MSGWALTVSISVALALLAISQGVVFGGGEEGLRVVVRSSARTSVALFAVAFSASSLRALWRARSTSWLLANRRYIGVSYAVSHAIHAAALLALYPASAEFRSSLDAVTLVGGGVAYAFTFAMALTSSDAAVRALGRRRWRRLHVLGGWYIWIIFAQSYLPRAWIDPAYVPAALVILAVPALRLAARLRGGEAAQLA